MGKGSKPRPIDRQKFDENFDRIFKKGDQCLAVDERESAEVEENKEEKCGF